ncbi:MAG: asparagine synthase (glutamine-hydrolyzing) [Acidobacteria bacterium]|nr:asparagine synthase (glutamine-hydrolyzing) [Acidobacteriota bacterium]
MCGIAGVVGSTDHRLISDMTDALWHRGPDSSGFFCRGQLQLGMRRLNIIDLRTGDQPIFNEARDKCIIFNGEIYNYKLLRDDLRQQGASFATNSDTEVILRLYEQGGAARLPELRGMFAFAIADGNTLLLARDRLGIKPLYYYHSPDGKLFAFASEIKALLRCPFISPTLDEQAVADRTVMGYIIGDGTYFEGIKCLPPGHYMTVSMEGEKVSIRQQPYYQVEVEPDPSLMYEPAKERLKELIAEAVESHLIADVEVGLTLSGGVDSSVLGLMMKRFYPSSINTFSVGDNDKTPDIELSRVIAGRIGSTHSETILDFDDYLKDITRCVWAEEQITSLLGLPSFCLFKVVGSRVKVCLNGEGADELFGGYSMYMDRLRTVGWAQNNLSKLKEAGIAVRSEVTEVVDFLASARSYEEYLKRLFLVDIKDQIVQRHLNLVDKYAMASSLEVRVPFLDNEFVDFVTRIPVNYKVRKDFGIGKYILKRAALEMFGDVMIDVVLRRKEGFPSAGYQYLSRFDKMCEASLPDSYLKDHELGRCFNSKRELLLFDLFRLIFIEHRGAIPEGFDLLEFIKEKSGTREMAYADIK